MDLSEIVASDITVYSKYAKYIPELKRRETWDEIVDRYEGMMKKKYPALSEDIVEACLAIRRKQVLPSMRALQFAGPAIERNNSRIYNCAFMKASYSRFFAETMFLLLGGTGVGYSVQERHISQLPVIQAPKNAKKFLVGDSIEGWADAVNALMKAFFEGKSLPRFDFSDVRQKGVRLVTAGGKAPGPGPLRVCLDKMLGILENKPVGSKLTSVEVSDLCCYIADAVLSGGIRRAAMICLFDIDDEHMLAYKKGAWWDLHPERARVNVSATALRTNWATFEALWKATVESQSGEPGIYWSNDLDQGTNPCCEIALHHKQFCNLTTINFSTVIDQRDLNRRVQMAAFLGTLQAGFTDFHYLGAEWEETCNREALLGVSLTGIGDKANYERFNFEEAAHVAEFINERTSALIGTNKAARITCIKPEGTASLVLGCSSGVHGRHSQFYIRRFRFKSNDPVVAYLAKKVPTLVVQDLMDPDSLILELPIRSPGGTNTIFRYEPALQTLERLRFFHKNWVLPGHTSGVNTHNVSCTVSVRETEWDAVGAWMEFNRDSYNGIAVLPWDGGSYVQAPFEECDEATFLEMSKHLVDIDLTEVIEDDDETNLVDQVACAGGACEIQ